MKKLFLALLIILLITAQAISKDKTAVVIPISGTIDFGLSAFIGRSIEAAKELKPDIIIFEVDTFGGRVDAALEIVDRLSAISDAKTVAFVNTKAISAGALISMAANEIIMVEGSTIGDSAPVVYGQEGPKMMGEKFQSPLRAKFRSLAEKNGYPVKLAESMVSSDQEILEIETKEGKRIITKKELEVLSDKEKSEIVSKRIILEEGKLLTMHAVEAVDLGFSRKTVKDLNGLLAEYGLTENNVKERFELVWSEKLVIFIEKIAPFLLMIGLAGLYIEIRTPGFGVPGIIGLVCLGLVFGSKMFVGLANYTEVLIFVIGVILLAIEVFAIPGFGITGVGGLILIFVSLVLSFQNFVIPTAPWEFESLYHNLFVIGTVFSLSLLFFLITLFTSGSILAKSPIAHKGNEGKANGFSSSQDYGALLNREGILLTDLHPTGYAEIGGTRTNVASRGEFITKGKKVKVVDISGNKIIVEEKNA